MIVDAQIAIIASGAAVWNAMTDIEGATNIIKGILGIEIIEKPSTGLVGLRWRETRMLFGKPATVEKWITDAIEGKFYTTRAESDGYLFLATTSIAENGNGSVTLTTSHDSLPQTLAARLSSPMMLLFKGVARKALLQDLQDIKTAVERTPT
ncbi:hypothetical protein AB4Z19_04080 [Pseudoduganella sp. RAF19]